MKGGFILVVYHTVLRDLVSNIEAAWTVDKSYLFYWDEKSIFVQLLEIMNTEEKTRSVVLIGNLLMDNASTHMFDEVEDAIRANGS